MHLIIPVTIGIVAWFATGQLLAATDAGSTDQKIVTGTYTAIGIGIVATLIARKVLK